MQKTLGENMLQFEQKKKNEVSSCKISPPEPVNIQSQSTSFPQCHHSTNLTSAKTYTYTFKYSTLATTNCLLIANVFIHQTEIRPQRVHQPPLQSNHQPTSLQKKWTVCLLSLKERVFRKEMQQASTSSSEKSSFSTMMELMWLFDKR